MRDTSRGKPPRAAHFFLLAAVLVIGVATLTPSSQEAMKFELCLACGELGGTDIILNVLLFIPLGTALSIRGVQRRRAILLMCCSTLAIECIQWAALVGRDPSLGDVVANSAGGAIGFYLADHRRHLLYPSSLAPSLLKVALGGWLLVQSIAAYALQPRPTTSLYFGQLMRALGSNAAYPGRILDVAVANIRVPDWDVRQTPEIREALASDSGATLAVTFESSKVPVKPVSVVRIADAEEREILSFSVGDGSMMYSIRTGAAELSLRPIQFRLRHSVIAQAEAGIPRGRDTIHGSVNQRSGSVTLSATINRGQIQQAAIPVSTSAGWRLAAPLLVYDDGSPTDAILDGFWTLLCVLPIGYWWRFATIRAHVDSTSSYPTTAGVVLVIAGGLIAIPKAFHTASTRWWEIVAVLLGLLAGYMLGGAVPHLMRKTARNRQSESA